MPSMKEVLAQIDEMTKVVAPIDQKALARSVTKAVIAEMNKGGDYLALYQAIETAIKEGLADQ